VIPVLGRNFTGEDDQPSAPKVGLLSYDLWSSRFGSSRDVVGKTIEIDGIRTRIAGVLPREFELPNLAHVDLVIPQALAIQQY
jgi:hypothetical protein